MSRKLKLAREWTLGSQIGQGGFGRVYEARSSGEAPAVAKLVPKVPGAERELLFVDVVGVRNVVPVIDSGETDDSWVLVMPRATMSLREHIQQVGRAFEPNDAIKVLMDILAALVDLDRHGIVHRDLKPENVLLLDDRWCLADFGISRYADATTAPDTKKFALSPPLCGPRALAG
jgi:serine/threonine-protein kinase